MAAIYKYAPSRPYPRHFALRLPCLPIEDNSSAPKRTSNTRAQTKRTMLRLFCSAAFLPRAELVLVSVTLYGLNCFLCDKHSIAFPSKLREISHRIRHRARLDGTQLLAELANRANAQKAAQASLGQSEVQKASPAEAVFAAALDKSSEPIPPVDNTQLRSAPSGGVTSATLTTRNSNSAVPSASSQSANAATPKTQSAVTSLAGQDTTLEAYCPTSLDSEALRQCKADFTAFKTIQKTGKPAQMYSAGMKLESARMPFALAMYQSIIDRFPDDKFSSRAIDKLETLALESKVQARRAQQQQQTQQQSPPPQPAVQRTNTAAARQTQVTACLSNCAASFNTCQTDVSATASLGNSMSSLMRLGGMGSTAFEIQRSSGMASCTTNYQSCQTGCSTN